MSRQPDLFTSLRPSRDPAEPDLPFIRKSLSRYLRLLRDAEILPWADHEAIRLARRFPALARPLPVEEREALVKEFFDHLTRLGCRFDPA